MGCTKQAVRVLFRMGTILEKACHMKLEDLSFMLPDIKTHHCDAKQCHTIKTANVALSPNQGRRIA